MNEKSAHAALGADAIDEQVRRIEAAVVAMAEETGARLDFHLHSDDWKAWGDAEPTVGTIVMATIAALGTQQETVVVKRHMGSWGLYYWTYRFSAPEVPLVHLRDAPLELRRRFLDRAEEFCERYAEVAQEMRRLRASEKAEQEAVAAEARAKGDRALSALTGL